MPVKTSGIARHSVEYAEVLAEVFVDTVRRSQSEVACCEQESEDITPSLMECLQYVYLHGPSPIGQIARGLEISLPASSQLVDRLVKKDLARRREDEQDRRLTDVRLTQAGREAVRQVRRRKSDWFASVVQSLEKDELEAFLDGMEGFLRIALASAENVDHACVHCGMEYLPFCVVNKLKGERKETRCEGSAGDDKKPAHGAVR